MPNFVKFAVLAVLAVPVFAQTPPASPAAQSAAAEPAAALTSAASPVKFEAADVHAVSHGSASYSISGWGDWLFLRQVTMSNLVAYAYGLKDSSYIEGGPSWLDWDRYDIVAKVPPGATQPKDVRLMLQDLLADRFKLVVHPGAVPMPVYALTVAKGNPNLKPSAATEHGECKVQSPANPEPGSFIVLECRGVTMDSLATAVREQTKSSYLDNGMAVVDATGLKGAYDFDLKWTPRNLVKNGLTVISPAQALEQQLGLKLEATAAPRSGMVVDSVNEEPTPNSPDLDSILPPLPRFEVASIRPAQPDEPGRRRIAPDAVDYQGATLKSLIVFAWSLNQYSDDVLVAPKWIADDRVDIHAKLPAGEVINFNDLSLMLRSLLVDRFQIKYHMEDRPVDAYTLVADRPRLTRANPSEKTGCKNLPGPVGKDPHLENGALDVLETCLNMTMDQFVGLLWQPNGLAPGYLHFPVKDATGLKGAWDFTIGWTSILLFPNGMPNNGQTPTSGDVPTGSDPNGATTLFEALRTQLGLKLLKEKRPEPVLVIDQINQQPTEN